MRGAAGGVERTDGGPERDIAEGKGVGILSWDHSVSLDKSEQELSEQEEGLLAEAEDSESESE